MSFQIQGQPFIPDYKAKEKRLYQIIASRESEIAAQAKHLEIMSESLRVAYDKVESLIEELRAMKAKERRRATKRKRVANEAG
jgi:hypothetical protein